jgi:predicted amidophosphoribosyltransferase
MTAVEERPKPLGFGRCGKCAYIKTGTPAICFTCARRSIEALQKERCLTCDLSLKPGETKCRNPLCNFDDRFFQWNYAAAMRSGVLEQAISLYKYGDQRGWAQIFARVLVGFLNDERSVFEGFGLIVASPTFMGTDGRAWDHTGMVIAEADALAEGAWPFDTAESPVIIKTAATERLAKAKNWHERRAIAQGPLRAALRIPDPSKTRGKRILVYDDIFTDGQTLNEVARCLRLAGGATEVCGVTLARQPWKK